MLTDCDKDCGWSHLGNTDISIVFAIHLLTMYPQVVTSTAFSTVTAGGSVTTIVSLTNLQTNALLSFGAQR